MPAKRQGGLRVSLSDAPKFQRFATTQCQQFGEMALRLSEFFLNQENEAIGSEAPYVGAGTVGESKHKGVIDLSWNRNQFSALWQASVTGPAVWANEVPANISAIQGVGAWWVNDLTAGYQVDSHLKVQLVIDNVFDKQVPYPLPATPYGSAILNGYFTGLLGRYFTAKASFAF